MFILVERKKAKLLAFLIYLDIIITGDNMITIIRDYFLLFMLYSMIGWVMEVIYVYTTKGKLSDRGFFIGPYCPIYGVGCILIIILLSGFKKYPVAVFILAILISSILEYFTSFLMEKLFKARWWDYTKAKYNINGRICLDTMLPFGIIACIILYLINPIVIRAIDKTPDQILTIIAITFAIIFLLDLITSFNVVNNFKKTIKKASLEDRTDDVNKYIRETLASKSLLNRRLLKAFPTGHAIIKKVKQLETKIEDTISIKKED